MPVAGSVVRELWLYLNAAGAPKGGMVSPTDVTLKLFVSTGGAFVGAGEAIAWVGVSGQTGYYDISYTPTGSGIYKLDLEELNADSFLRRWSFTQEVVAAGAVFLPLLTNAFCAISDIERWAGMSINSGTTPSDTVATAFAEERAAILMSLMAGWGVPITPATVVNASRMQDLLRTANALGAAVDCILAQELTLSPSASERAALRQAMWVQYVGGRLGESVTPVGWIEKEIRMNVSSLASNHILSGDTLPPAATSPPTDIGVGPITMEMLF